MTGPDSQFTLRAASVAVMLVALALTYNAARTLVQSSVKLKEYVGHSTEVREEEKAAARSAAAVRMFEELSNPHPVPLADLLKQSFTGDKYEIVERTAQPTIEGWQVRRREVTLPEIQLSQLGTFLVIAETQRPPWRLVSCRIISTGAEGGAGRVSLTFDALEKDQ